MVALTLLGLGCDHAPTPTPTEQQIAQVTPAARAPDRGRVRGGQKVQRRVRWPAQDSRDMEAYAALDEPSRAAIDAAPVPVLVPTGPLVLDRKQVMHGPQWYAFWGQRQGVTVTLSASGQAHVYAGVVPKPGPYTLRGQQAYISRNEGIWSATWIEHGVAYDLGLECAPVDAPPCDDDTTLTAMAESLAFVGGARQGAR